SDHRVPRPEVDGLQTRRTRDEAPRRAAGRVVMEDPPADPPPRPPLDGPAGRQEGQVVPRDPSRRNDRRRPQTEAGPPAHARFRAWQGRLRVPSVRRRVSPPRVAEEREGAPAEKGGRHAPIPIPRGRPGEGPLATARASAR